jgi:catechol 2,3-dioxygenase-like lactoylglutathione lyase family enzyme
VTNISTRFVCVELYFDDLDRAKKFYVETLGLHISDEVLATVPNSRAVRLQDDQHGNRIAVIVAAPNNRLFHGCACQASTGHSRFQPVQHRLKVLEFQFQLPALIPAQARNFGQ